MLAPKILTHLLIRLVLQDALPHPCHYTNLLKRVQDLLAVLFHFLLDREYVVKELCLKISGIRSPLPPLLFSMVVFITLNTVRFICFYLHSVSVFFLLSFLIWLYFSNMLTCRTLVCLTRDTLFYTSLVPYYTSPTGSFIIGSCCLTDTLLKK